jgi:hypothetical protein
MPDLGKIAKDNSPAEILAHGTARLNFNTAAIEAMTGWATAKCDADKREAEIRTDAEYDFSWALADQVERLTSAVHAAQTDALALLQSAAGQQECGEQSDLDAAWRTLDRMSAHYAQAITACRDRYQREIEIMERSYRSRMAEANIGLIRAHDQADVDYANAMNAAQAALQLSGASDGDEPDWTLVDV